MNMVGHPGMLFHARVALLAAITLGCPGLIACSGPGAPTSIARNMGFGFACFVGAALIAIPVMVLRFRRRGFRPRTLIPLLGLAVHPAWTISATSGDCGDMKWLASVVVSALWIFVLLYEVISTVDTRTEQRHRLGKAGYFVVVVLLAVSAGTWILPWKLNPMPIQHRYLKYMYFEDVRAQQITYKSEHGVFAPSARKLFAGSSRGHNHAQIFEMNRGNSDELVDGTDQSHWHFARVLQGTTDDPDAWQVPGGLNDWAVIARPVGFPQGGRWVQYLYLSDGSVWIKEDPGNGEYLLEGVPSDPAADGWLKEEDLSNYR